MRSRSIMLYKQARYLRNQAGKYLGPSTTLFESNYTSFHLPPAVSVFVLVLVLVLHRGTPRWDWSEMSDCLGLGLGGWVCIMGHPRAPVRR